MTVMSYCRRAGLLACVLMVFTLSLGARRFGADDEVPDEVFLLGTIKSIETGGEGRAEFVVKGKSFVAPTLKGVIGIKHKAVRLGDVASGTTLRVLGRRQETSRAPGQYLSAQIIQISAMTTANFPISPLTEAQKKLKLIWISGTMDADGVKSFKLDGTNMQIGADRFVLIAEAAKIEDLAKGARVRLRVPRSDVAPIRKPKGGDSELGAGKDSGDAKDNAPRPLHLIYIELLTDAYPAKEYSQVLGE